MSLESRHRWVRVVGVAFAIAFSFTLGCGDSGDGSGSRVGTLMIAGGDQQQAPTEAPLPKPIQIRVVGKDGNVLPGVSVRFDTLEGRGSFVEQFVVSDQKGIASVQYNLGRLPVRNRMRASITGASVDLEALALNTHPPVPRQRIDGLPLPEGLAFDNAGNALVTSQLNGSVLQIHPGPFKTSDQFLSEYLYRGKSNSSLTGITLDAAGNLYACDNRTGSIVKIDGSEEPKIFVEGYQFEPFSLPNGIAAHPRTDDIYFSDSERNRIYRVNPQGKELAIVTEAVPQPNGLAFSAAGDVLYVASLAGGVFALPLDRGGVAGTPAKLADVPTADGIALDQDGNIFVTGTELGKLAGGVYLVPADGSPAFRYIAAPSGKIYANIAFGREGFSGTALYLVSLNGTLDEVELGTPGLVLPGPPAG